MHRQEGGERLLVNVKGMGECQWVFALANLLVCFFVLMDVPHCIEKG